jgi:5-methyltetrahydropteroyltriglutamate--homocysteine methyltransferase
MNRSTDRILTTHVGSLPRPDDLREMLQAVAAGESVDEATLATRSTEAVAEVVRKQTAAGIDMVSDGEQSKTGYLPYIQQRLTGFAGGHQIAFRGDWAAFPEAAKKFARTAGGRPACNGPIDWKDRGAVQRDLDNYAAALKDAGRTDAFMTAASPGVIATLVDNEYYASSDEYLARIADVMKEEYDAIYKAGYILQLDCPDLGMSRHWQYVDMPTPEFLKVVETNIEALNHATRDIPADRMRLHLCWGNYIGPHQLDIPLRDLLAPVLKARPEALSFEGANPRHEHEWALFEEVKLPEDKVILPGMIDSTTNFIEHPELVAQRIVRYANLVGRENVIASSDCGFSTFARNPTVEPEVTWAKLASLAEGAQIASKQLW